MKISPRARRRLNWAVITVCSLLLLAAIAVPAIRRHTVSSGLICVTALVGIAAAVVSLRASGSRS